MYWRNKRKNIFFVSQVWPKFGNSPWSKFGHCLVSYFQNHCF